MKRSWPAKLAIVVVFVGLIVTASLLETGGACGMTDVLTPYIISPRDGELFSCRGTVGGGHCFCRPKQSLLQPQETIEIATGFDSDVAVNWVPQEPADYVVVGMYRLRAQQRVDKIVYSPPLVIHVIAAE